MRSTIRGPPGEAGRRGGRLDAETGQNEVVEPLAAELEGDFVDRVHVERLDHACGVHVGEAGDLGLDLFVERVFGAADEHGRLNPGLHQFAHRVLGRLGLELAGGADVGDEGQVDVQGAGPDLLAELADPLQERQALDVAHGAAHLADHHVVALREHAHRSLDLVGDVGDDLYRAPQVVAPALPVDDRPVDAPRGGVVLLGQAGVDEAFVVAEIKVRLGAVLGHVHLAVLQRRKRTRVDVDVGVEFLQSDAEPPLLQEHAERCGGNPLPQRRNHAAGHKDVPGPAGFDRGHGLAVAPCRPVNASAPVPPASGRSRPYPRASMRRSIRSRSSGVSTPPPASRTIATPMRIPFSSARNCSSFSSVSSGEGLQLAHRASAPTVYA